MGALKPLCDLLVVNDTKTILDAISNMLNVSHTHCVYTLSNGQCQYRDIVLLVVNVLSLSQNDEVSTLGPFTTSGQLQFAPATQSVPSGAFNF